ncbi:MAG TPA: ClpX C4-type zinc finger protein [Burkholderiales bacterium]
MTASDDSEHRKLELEFRNLANELRRFRGRPPLHVSNVSPEGPTCLFCGLAKNQVEALVAGPTANICNECVELCQDIITRGAQ